MLPDELIDNMAKTALNYADTDIEIHRNELLDPIMFNKMLLEIYNFTAICFENVINEFKRNIKDVKTPVYLYDIMDAKRRFNAVMQEVENRLIFAKLKEERRIFEDESDAGCETQSP